MQSQLASPPSRLLPFAEAARRLGVGPDVVRAWADAGLLIVTHSTSGDPCITATELAVARRALGFPD